MKHTIPPSGLTPRPRLGARLTIPLVALVAMLAWSWDGAPLFAAEAKPVANSLGMNFVQIEAGEFLMGSPAGEKGRYDGETQHKVKITKPFALGACLVTRGQFAAFVKDSGYQTDAEKAGDKETWKNPGLEQTDDHPVVYVSWNDAQAFCQWLSKKEGKTYRLPTEAQWEYACRAGTTTQYNTGDGDKALDEAGWYGGDNGGNSGGKTHPVGQKKANAWGLYDMHGNVFEWCSDYGGPYPAGDAVDPAGPAQGGANPSRVLRGASWNCVARLCRAAYRSSSAPGDRNEGIGFRCALDVP